jgi:geranylgeranylglycerol-phosphate geranylgeranyltransferase
MIKQVDTKIVGVIQLMRPESSVPAGIYTLLGAYLATDQAAFLTQNTLLAALIVVLIVAYGFVINDYKDGEVDRIDKPHRPIPSGVVSLRMALYVALILALTVQVLAWTRLGAELALFAVATILLSTAYSFFLKSTLLLGNLAMAILASSILIFGGLAAHGLPTKLWIATLLVFIYILAQEVFYTVEDLNGDSVAGLRTTATVLGAKRTVLLYQLLAVIFAIAAILPWVLNLTTPAYLGAVLLCAVAPLLGAATLLAIRVSAFTIRVSVYTIWIGWYLSVLPILLLK